MPTPAPRRRRSRARPRRPRRTRRTRPSATTTPTRWPTPARPGEPRRRRERSRASPPATTASSCRRSPIPGRDPPRRSPPLRRGSADANGAREGAVLHPRSARLTAVESLLVPAGNGRSQLLFDALVSLVLDEADHDEAVAELLALSGGDEDA